MRRGYMKPLEKIAMAKIVGLQSRVKIFCCVDWLIGSGQIRFELKCVRGA